jgi:hypothetical protein
MAALLALVCLPACNAFLSPADALGVETGIDFQRDIAPIFAEHCNHCHGVDEATRQGGLRLDQRETAIRGGESGLPAIIPFKGDQGEVLKRILSKDPEKVMPPPSEKKPLAAMQIEKIQKWIGDGAAYSTHWAFTAPQKGYPPGPQARHPIDAFVIDRLEREKLPVKDLAPLPVLARRLYLDLVGLPPSPSEFKEFETQGYEATVDKLLASERFGEKWGRHWLDLARYSDTNGYEKDLQREQWKYRDWVIDALNRDMPYDRFIIEQLAGDLLPSPSPDQIIATGFLRNSMINEEGAIVPEQFRMVELFDRMDCIGKSILGLTTQCAQCHTHKFDPITQDEYYGMFAFLNNSYEARSWVYTDQQLKQIADIHRKLDELDRRSKEKRPAWQTELIVWENEIRAQEAVWRDLVFHQLESVSGLNHPTQEADQSILMLGHTSGDVFFVSKPEATGITGLRLELLNHDDLPHGGPGRSRLGTWGIHEVELYSRAPDAKEWTKHKLVNATADYAQPEQKSADGKKKSGPEAFLIDGTDDSTWLADRGPGRHNRPSVAVVQLETPLDLPKGSELKIAMRMSDMVGCCRWSLTSTPNPETPRVDYEAQMAIRTPAESRSAHDQAILFHAWRQAQEDLKEIQTEVDAVWNSFPQAPTSILHLKEKEPSKQRVTHLLDRGSWDRPKHRVAPKVPEAFHPFPSGAPSNRLGFALWLVDRKSPLTARVAVNRIWQAVFGAGLVETSDDFGTRAPVPEYRELLDWLAVELMDRGWSQKEIIRLIVTSDTYKRSSIPHEEHLERDPKNILLARGPRFRLEAELVRDLALSVSGILHHKTGGPGVIPPVPQNVLDYNYVYPSYWKAAEGPDRYRRAVYGFRKRSMPDPVMSNLDAPNGDLSCARRVRSNTPLAALTGLNEIVFVEAARALALRVLREAGSSDPERIEYAFRLCLCRLPSPDEKDEVLSLLATRRTRIAEGWLNPREISTGDAARLPVLPSTTNPQDAAAWTIVARVLLNLDETLSKN